MLSVVVVVSCLPDLLGLSKRCWISLNVLAEATLTQNCVPCQNDAMGPWSW